MKKIKNQQELEERMAEALALKAEIDVEVGAANEAMAANIKLTVHSIAESKAKYDEIEAAIRDYATVHKDDPEYFGEKRSIDLIAGSIGWSLGKNSVEELDGFDAKTFPKLARKLGFEEIIRTPDEELDKSAVIRLASNNEITESQLLKLGLKVKQDDNFTIKFKKLDKKKVGA